MVYCDTLMDVFCTETGMVAEVDMYVFQGVVPWVDVTVPETDTEPVTGRVADVEM